MLQALVLLSQKNIRSTLDESLGNCRIRRNTIDALIRRRLVALNDYQRYELTEQGWHIVKRLKAALVSLPRYYDEPRSLMQVFCIHDKPFDYHLMWRTRLRFEGDEHGLES